MLQVIISNLPLKLVCEHCRDYVDYEIRHEINKDADGTEYDYARSYCKKCGKEIWGGNQVDEYNKHSYWKAKGWEKEEESVTTYTTTATCKHIG